MQREEFVHLDAVEKEIEGRYAVWKALYDLQQKVIDWTTGPVLNLSDNTVSGHNSVIVSGLQCRKAGPRLRMLRPVKGGTAKPLTVLSSRLHRRLLQRLWNSLLLAAGVIAAG